MLFKKKMSDDENNEVIDEELQELKNDLKKAEVTYMAGLRNLFRAEVNYRNRLSADGEPIVQKAKRTRKPKEDVPSAASSKEASKKAKPAPEAAEGPFVCEGNVFAETPCPNDSDAHSKPAPAKTKGPDGKLHATCKPCKKEIKKWRKENPQEKK